MGNFKSTGNIIPMIVTPLTLQPLWGHQTHTNVWKKMLIGGKLSIAYLIPWNAH